MDKNDAGNRDGATATIPLEVRGELIGWLRLKWSAGPWSLEREPLAHTFATQIAISIRNSRMFRLAEEAQTLTELNRLRSGTEVENAETNNTHR